ARMEVIASRRKLYLAFVALAILAGPVDQYISSSFLAGSPLPTFHSLPIAALLTAIVLAALAAIRRDRMPNRAEWSALVILSVLLGIAIVVSWALARLRLGNCPVAPAAAVYLALSFLGYAAFAAIYERSFWHAADWQLSWATLLPEIATLVVSWLLWFWLLA